MKDFKVRLKELTDPYRISRPVDMDPLYDYGVCSVLEELIYEYMDKGEISASFNYCDFECDGACVKGCMTITYFEIAFVPRVFTFLYERDLNTCYE